MFRHFGHLHYRSFPSFCQLANKVYGIASKIGGSSTDSLYDRYAGKFQNGDLQSFKAKVYKSSEKGVKEEILSGVNIITTPQQCKRCLDILMNANTIAAWDTQTMDLDIKQEAPVGKGKIICASFFAGPYYNFGRGPRVFIDNFGKNAGLIDYFKPYLESEKHLKVWHNYGFDRHLFYNHGIDVKGFGGDTMHMARLLDPSKIPSQYALSSLTGQYQKLMRKQIEYYLKQQIEKYTSRLANEKDQRKNKIIRQQQANFKLYYEHYSKLFKIKKEKLEKIFGRKRMLKNGYEGITYQYPTTLTLHTNNQYLQKWIQYGVLDSQSTFFLRRALERQLKEKSTNNNRKQYQGPNNMADIYQMYWRPFGEVLTDIERVGIKVDLQHMKSIADQARHDLKKKEQFFLNFLYTFQNGKNIDHFNLSSPLQLQQLLFAPCEVKHEQAKRNKQKQKQQKTNRMTEDDKKLSQYAGQSQKQAYDTPKEGNKTVRKAVTLNQLVKTFKVQNKNGITPKYVQMEVMGLGLPYNSSTPTGIPSVEEAVLQELAGDISSGKYGKAYHYFKQKGNQQFGKDLCQALKILSDYSSIETLLKTFIQPLISYVDNSGRIHCSLNINTETGRLSARKPNLQNQPALDKDIYKIRKGFVADKGKKFIVADYGQLQLRVLAHLTKCQAMIKAFKEGGDFHSRTAIGMYDYIKKDLDQGKILLQWDKSKGKPPVPLLKDKYASQRKKAKTVNFSIAYGKTAGGFAKDWNCSLDEAKVIIEAWFKDRPEVKEWQKDKQKLAKGKYFTQTLLGRYRSLKKFYQNSPNHTLLGMGDRRAINTPIQGGAADIVIASMVKISHDKSLKQLGWTLLMQIHDQLILQGPQQSAEQALSIVKYNMSHPFDFQLLVQLQVDAKIGNNWYECK